MSIEVLVVGSGPLVDLVGSLRILYVLSRKITNVRGAQHFPQEVLQGAQEFAYEGEEREAPANDIPCQPQSLLGRLRLS